MSALFQTTIFSLLLVCAIASLNKDNLSTEAGDRAVFIKFFAPWCGHCKAMAPAWETLTTNHQDSKTLFVAECDCTGDCKDLCSHVGVKGYPTIKYGDPLNLDDYKGGRDLEAMQAHAKTIKLSCSPSRRDSCSPDETQEIDDLLAKPRLEIAEIVLEKEGIIAAAEEDFKKAVEGLQETYTNLLKTKDEKIEEVNQSGLKLLKAVLSHTET